MESNSLNLIPPVAGLQKPVRVSPTDRREERKRQPSREDSGEHPPEVETTETQDTEIVTPTIHDEDTHTLDYCA